MTKKTFAALVLLGFVTQLGAARLNDWWQAPSAPVEYSPAAKELLRSLEEDEWECYLVGTDYAHAKRNGIKVTPRTFWASVGEVNKSLDHLDITSEFTFGERHAINNAVEKVLAKDRESRVLRAKAKIEKK